MAANEWLAEQFEENRDRLRALAYRALGSVSDADDAVQETWLRLSRSHANAIENLRGWLTTVLSRVCLDMLRSRASCREEALEYQVERPAGNGRGSRNPEEEALMADSIGDFEGLIAVLDSELVVKINRPAARLGAPSRFVARATGRRERSHSRNKLELLSSPLWLTER